MDPMPMDDLDSLTTGNYVTYRLMPSPNKPTFVVAQVTAINRSDDTLDLIVLGSLIGHVPQGREPNHWHKTEYGVNV